MNRQHLNKTLGWFILVLFLILIVEILIILLGWQTFVMGFSILGGVTGISFLLYKAVDFILPDKK